MAINGDGAPVTDLFGWRLPSSTGAAGSLGATESDALADSALSSQVTMPYQSVQNVSVPRVGVGLDDANVPSQNVSYGAARDPLTGLGAELGQTGAGLGHVGGAGNPNAGGRP